MSRRTQIECFLVEIFIDQSAIYLVGIKTTIFSLIYIIFK